MTTLPSPFATVQYQNFQHPPPSNAECSPNFGVLTDRDGFSVYENEYGGLLLRIIELSDVAILTQYLATLKTSLARQDDSDDPFYVAVANGSTDALRVLLEHWDAADHSLQRDVPAPDMRRFGLLHVACETGHIETVRFLLDGPWKAKYGNVHARDCGEWGSTAILAAAASFYPQERSSKEWSLDLELSRLARLEEIMHLLLDRGASARDVIKKQHLDGPLDNVLTLAMCGAGTAIVRRLIDEGADMRAKVNFEAPNNNIYKRFGAYTMGDVTALHIGSLFCNIAGIQALLACAKASNSAVALVRQPDRSGNLPLDWAAWASELDTCTFDVQNNKTILKLLQAVNCSTEDAKDKECNTSLHSSI